MMLTPLDIRKQEFNRRMRGYDPDDVRHALDGIADAYEELLSELRRRDERIRDLENKMRHYERVEEALQDAVVTARETAKQAIALAEARAEQLRLEAMRDADGIVRGAEQEHARLRQETQAIAGRRKEIVTRLRSFLISEMEMLAHYDGDDPVGYIKLMPGAAPAALPPAPSDGLGAARRLPEIASETEPAPPDASARQFADEEANDEAPTDAGEGERAGDLTSAAEQADTDAVTFAEPPGWEEAIAPREDPRDAPAEAPKPAPPAPLEPPAFAPEPGEAPVPGTPGDPSVDALPDDHAYGEADGEPDDNEATAVRNPWANAPFAEAAEPDGPADWRGYQHQPVFGAVPAAPPSPDDDDDRPVSGSSEEIDRIRRLLSGLD